MDNQNVLQLRDNGEYQNISTLTVAKVSVAKKRLGLHVYLKVILSNNTVAWTGGSKEVFWRYLIVQKVQENFTILIDQKLFWN